MLTKKSTLVNYNQIKLSKLLSSRVIFSKIIHTLLGIPSIYKKRRTNYGMQKQNYQIPEILHGHPHDHHWRKCVNANILEEHEYVLSVTDDKYIFYTVIFFLIFDHFMCSCFTQKIRKNVYCCVKEYDRINWIVALFLC